MKLRTSLLGAFSCLCNWTANAELSIQITQGVDNPIPIAVVPFSNESGGFFSEDVSQIVINDLEQVGEFRA
ncbi:MAG: Tol-Pal system protein TolB, partial [Pseudomonadales bacterium]|nr:Tol-Pal system protein TolB [Pseudomonadales bacterium]